MLNHVFLHSINAWLLICPDWLSFDWSMGSVTTIRSWTDYRLISIFIHITALFFLFARICLTHTRRRRTRLAMLVLAIVPFLPASGIIHVGFVVAERLLYTPSIGWCLFVGLGFREILKRSSSKFSKVVLKSFFILIIILFILKTRSRASEWKSEQSLYQSALRVCPNNAKVHYNIAKKSDPTTAIAFYQHAIVLYPDYDAALMNLGNLYRDRADLEKAEFYLRRALKSIKIT